MSRPVSVRELRARRLTSVSSVSDELDDRGIMVVVTCRFSREAVGKTCVSEKGV
jgi:hypothetical protein